MKNRTWFITGISSGLGKALAERVLENGDFVIGSFRNQQQAAQFNQDHKGQGLAVVLDLTQPAEIEAVYQQISKAFPSLDVLVNNAGYGFAGAVEEASMAEARAVFEANFFGTLHLTQSFLPLFRKQKRGHIVQLSSQAGVKATAGFGIYNASKFALEGFSEALALEIAPLGIHLTIVEPGPFRTQFAGSSFNEAHTIIDDYKATVGAFRSRMKNLTGTQEGDPIKAAQAIIDITQLEKPPLRLPLGKLAIQSIQSKIDSMQQDLNTYRALAESVVFGS